MRLAATVENNQLSVMVKILTDVALYYEECSKQAKAKNALSDRLSIASSSLYSESRGLNTQKSTHPCKNAQE